MTLTHRIIVAAASAALLAGASLAELPVGSPAPDFTTDAALNGARISFSLAEALKKGPVVLYFYPAAFTKGCTVEAHDFAEATDAFAALGATVIGVSADDIETLQRFSVSECQGKFAVASDKDQAIMKAYDAVLDMKPELADRTSYVISPEGEILYAYTALNPDAHVQNTMEAVKAWKNGG